MCKKIFVGNYKGGVGKTTTVYQIGACLAAKHNKKVLLMDLDPQCSLSKVCASASDIDLTSLSVEETLNYALELYKEYISSSSRISILEGDIHTNYTVVEGNIKPINKYKGLCFIPTVLDMKNSRLNDIAERFSANSTNALVIAKFFDDICYNCDFDYILCDCPPTSNIITQSVFLACDYYLIPTIGDEISIDGVTDYVTEIESTYLKYSYDNIIGGLILKKYFGAKPQLLGVLETLYKNRANSTEEKNGVYFRKPELLSGLRSIDEPITDVVKDSVISHFPEYRYKQLDNFFKVTIRNLDNRSNPNDYGIPVTMTEGDLHNEYAGISAMINDILK